MSVPGDPVVHISVDDRGNFTYQPATIRVTVTGDDHSSSSDTRLTSAAIRWNYSGPGAGPFAVHFPRSPFNRVVIQNSGDHATHPEEGRIRREAPPGVYNYAVAVVRDNRVFIDACPEVIIECG